MLWTSTLVIVIKESPSPLESMVHGEYVEPMTVKKPLSLLEPIIPKQLLAAAVAVVAFPCLIDKDASFKGLVDRPSSPMLLYLGSSSLCFLKDRA